VGNICVYAAQDKAKPIAIIVPAEPALKSMAQQNGVSGEAMSELVNDEKINELVLKELQAQGKRGGLAGIEIIEGVVLTDEEWTPQNVSDSSGTNQRAVLMTIRDWSPLHRS